MARQNQVQRMKKRVKGYKVKPKVARRSRSAGGIRDRLVSSNRVGRFASFPGYGFPDELVLSCSYGDNATLTLGSNQTAVYNTYSLNNLYDPDQAVGGHQPMLYDQIKAIYTKYTVLGAKITVMFAADQIQGLGPWAVGIESSDHSQISTSSTISTLMEQPGSSCDVIAGDHARASAVATYSPAQLGCTSYDDDVGANIGTYPNKQWFAHVWASNQNSSPAASKVNAFVRIEYRVRFSDRITQTSS